MNVTNTDNDYILEKYRPTNLSDFVGNEEQIKKAQDWMNMFKSKSLPKNKKGLLLIGPPGVGKTTFAHILMKKNGFLCKEFNGSTMRSEKDVADIMSSIIHSVSIVDMFLGKKFANAEKFSNQGISLPIDPNLSLKELKLICRVLNTI